MRHLAARVQTRYEHVVGARRVEVTRGGQVEELRSAAVDLDLERGKTRTSQQEDHAEAGKVEQEDQQWDHRHEVGGDGEAHTLAALQHRVRRANQYFFVHQACSLNH